MVVQKVEIPNEFFMDDVHWGSPTNSPYFMGLHRDMLGHGNDFRGIHHDETVLFFVVFQQGHWHHRIVNLSPIKLVMTDGLSLLKNHMVYEIGAPIILRMLQKVENPNVRNG